MPKPSSTNSLTGCSTNLATKADIEQIRADIEKRHLENKAEIVTAKHDLVKWIVTMNLTTAAVIVAVIKLI